MPAFELTFRGSGFVDAADPTGRQIIDGFSLTLYRTAESEADARSAGMAAVLADPRIQNLICETHVALQEKNSWKIECTAITRLRFWHWFRVKRLPNFSVHWSDARPENKTA